MEMMRLMNDLGEFQKDLLAKNNCNILNLSSQWDILKNHLKPLIVDTLEYQISVLNCNCSFNFEYATFITQYLNVYILHFFQPPRLFQPPCLIIFNIFIYFIYLIFFHIVLQLLSFTFSSFSFFFSLVPLFISCFFAAASFITEVCDVLLL